MPVCADDPWRIETRGASFVPSCVRAQTHSWALPLPPPSLSLPLPLPLPLSLSLSVVVSLPPHLALCPFSADCQPDESVSQVLGITRELGRCQGAFRGGKRCSALDVQHAVHHTHDDPALLFGSVSAHCGCPGAPQRTLWLPWGTTAPKQGWHALSRLLRACGVCTCVCGVCAGANMSHASLPWVARCAALLMGRVDAALNAALRSRSSRTTA